MRLFPFISRKGGFHILPNEIPVLHEEENILGHVSERCTFRFARYEEDWNLQLGRETLQQPFRVLFALESLRVGEIRLARHGTGPDHGIAEDDPLAEFAAKSSPIKRKYIT